MSWLDNIKFNSDGLIPAIAQDHISKRVLMVAWMNAESLQLTANTKTAVYFSRSRQKLWKKGETSGHIQQVHSIRLDCDSDVILLSITQLGGIACHTGRESCFYRELELTSSDNGELIWNPVDPVLKDPKDIYNKSSTHNHSTCNHDGEHTSNYQETLEAQSVLTHLDTILAQRKLADPNSSYVASLYHKGLNKVLEKVGEESFETVIAAKDYQTALDNVHTKNVQDNDSGKSIIDLQKDLVYEITDVWFHTMVTLAWFDISSDLILIELARRFGLSGIEEKASRGQNKKQ